MVDTCILTLLFIYNSLRIIFNLLIHFEYENHVELVTNMNISINK